MGRWTWALATTLLLTACGGSPGADEGTTAAALPDGPGPWAEAAIERYRVPVEDSPGRGADAPLVTVVLFSDFQCSYCRTARPTVERLLEAYPDTLRLHFRHLPLPMHPHAEGAAMAAVEARAQAGDAGFWRMHDRMFDYPDALAVEDLVGHAAALGLDAERMRVALRGRVHADALERDLAIADRVGADGTPTFFVNGRPVLGAVPFEEFRLVIDRELALAREALERGVPRARVYEAAMRDARAEAPRRRRPEVEAPPEEGRTELDRESIYAIPIDGAPSMGPADAPVTVVIFSDFECPFCGRVLPTLRELLVRYPDQLRLVFRHRPLPFHAHAELAAQAALEAQAQRGDEGFWAMHDALFADPRALRFDDLVSRASQLGLDLDRFRAALEGGTHEPALERDLALAERFGARGTPTFYVNGRVLTGAQPLPIFEAAVDEALERARAEQARGTAAADVYAALTADGASQARWVTVRPPPLRVHLDVPEDAPRRGAAEPALVVQVFTDFQCPFCARVGPAVERLLREFPQVQLAYRSLPLPFHEDALPAAIAAVEVHRQLGDEGFWRMYDRLFEHQDALDAASLVRHAEAVGADPTAVARALEQETHRDRVRADLRAIVDTGLRVGTPAFLIGDRVLMGAQPYEEFEAAVREELAGEGQN